MENMKISDLFRKFPHALSFFDVNSLKISDETQTVKEFINSLSYVYLEDMGIDANILLKRFTDYMHHIEKIQSDDDFCIKSLTVIGGKNKRGEPENKDITIHLGEIVCIVGPTGSGKSRLLADIEWMAQQDTPTERKILIDGKTPPQEWRFSSEHRLVAQLTQNMNFVMDITVGEFINLHAQSRMVSNVSQRVSDIISHANDLSGEQFSLDTPLTSLSGGQSRALMVADIAFLSLSPIVLIDEIENAGIDRQKAMKLLTAQNKIIVIVTHDPLLALMGQRRIVIKDGGILDIIKTNEDEIAHFEKLTLLDSMMLNYRNKLRNGERLDFKDIENIPYTNKNIR